MIKKLLCSSMSIILALAVAVPCFASSTSGTVGGASFTATSSVNNTGGYSSTSCSMYSGLSTTLVYSYIKDNKDVITLQNTSSNSSYSVSTSLSRPSGVNYRSYSAYGKYSVSYNGQTTSGSTNVDFY